MADPAPDADFEAMAALARQAPVAPTGEPEPTLAQVSATPAPQPVGPSAPPASPIGDSMAADYQNHRNAISDQAAFEAMQRQAQAEPTTAAPKPTASAAQPAEAQPGNWPGPGASMIYNAATHRYEPDPNVHPGGVGAADVGSDVLRGAMEAPRMIVKGARDAVQSMLDGALSLGKWIESALPEGISSLDKMTPATLPGADMREATTVTGAVVKNISQFVTSMSVVGKALEGAQLPSAIKGAAAMFAGFEGKQQRLSDLVEKVPELQNPVSDFLSSKPDDNEAVGRLKNAVEGLGIGALADGLVHAIRFLKGGADAQRAVEVGLPGAAEEQPKPAAQTAVEAPKASALDALGDAAAPDSAPLVQVQDAKQAAAQRATSEIEPGQAIKAAEPATAEELAGQAVPGATEAQAKEPVFHVNFARIDGPDDVKRALSEMAAAQSQNVDAARRGIQTFEDTRIGAATKDAFQLLMERRVGQPLNDQEMLAARQLEYQSASKLTDSIYAATDNPTPENLLAYRKMMTTHAMISAEVRGAQAEIARAQSSMRIPVGTGDTVDRMRAVLGGLQDAGGVQANLEDLYRVRQLVESGDMTTLGNVAEKSMYARTRDALLNAWTNGLVSGPLTHAKVALSNVATIALRLTETRVAESLDKLWGVDNGVVAGETAQATAGLVQGLKDAFRFAWKTNQIESMQDVQAGFKSDGTPLMQGSNAFTDAAAAFKSGQYSVGKPTDPWGSTLESQLATDTTQMSDSGWLGKGMDLLGQTIRTPGRALTAEHEFFRSIGMRMELNRFAIRQATAEMNAGQIGADGFNGRIAELVENHPPGLMDQAVNGMTYQTFTDAPGKLAELIQQARENFPLLRTVLPFYKIPSRILSFSFERTPIAPLMSGFRADISAGGARQSMALAKIGLGTSVMLAAADHVFNGQMTGAGPVEKGKRLAMENEGWQPYSIKVGDRWVQYNRLETVGSSMAMAADVAETIRDYQSAINTDDPDVEKLTVAAALAVANDVTSKTYLTGLANMFEAIANPKMGGESALRSIAGSLVPAGVATIAKAEDPYKRQVNSMLDAIKARTPGVSQSLPPQRNVWGEPVSHESGLGKTYDAFVPFATHGSADEPIDKELLRLGMNVNLPPAATTIQSAKVNLKEDPAMYSRYVELAGNVTKDPLTGMGTKDALNALVGGTHPLSPIYNLHQDEGKQTMIENIVKSQRDRAKGELLAEYPQLREKVEQTGRAQQQLKALGIQSQAR